VWENISAPAGTWTEVTYRFNDDYTPGKPVKVHFQAEDGIDVHSVALV
jgi:hypothetical protein